MDLNEFEGLRQKLEENKTWPLKYMFKFIVPNIDGRVESVISVLPDNGKNSFRHTKSLRHVSITCIALVNSADEIIDITYRARQIEGVMSL